MDAPTVVQDGALARKARGAFFTPVAITSHLAHWALRDQHDRVLEPSAGEAAFLVSAVRRLRELGAAHPTVYGAELHKSSAEVARDLVDEAGGTADIAVGDFFLLAAGATFDAVIGNPPFVRYQGFSGANRDRARLAALEGGVTLSGLASSWAAFVVHSARFLKPGGRLGMVLPAELLSVNYAGPVREFLLTHFADVELVLFEEQVFAEAEADTVLVKADGWLGEPARRAVLRQTKNAGTLESLGDMASWAVGEDKRWSPVPLATETLDALEDLRLLGVTSVLDDWGDTTLGAVTGSNEYFALSPERARELGIPRRDLVRVSPPGSAHLRGLALTNSAMTRLGQRGSATWLIYPSDRPAPGTLKYLADGFARGVANAYKCRTRKPWWRVPVLNAPDLFLTYMNADTARITTNLAGVRHLNSVHGIYLKEDRREVGRGLLPLASLNSVSLLSAERVGRSYGGGILKIEPREADQWLMPSSELVRRHASALAALKPSVQSLLQVRHVQAAVALVDEVLWADLLTESDLRAIRADHGQLSSRRLLRGKSGRAF